MQSKKCKWIIIFVVIAVILGVFMMTFSFLGKKYKFDLDTKVIGFEKIDNKFNANVEVNITHNFFKEITLSQIDLALYERNNKLVNIDLPDSLALKPNTDNKIPVLIEIPMKELMSLGIAMSPSFYIKGKVKTKLLGVTLSKSVDYPIDFNYRLFLKNENIIDAIDSTLIKVGKKVFEHIKTKLED
ncbi:MAG TPA: hypothetical protein PL063_08335 [Candidatus Cloacimonadota bacterium]|nr:hypothetical protein [Candidatus Cloacimonadota bacterium]HQB41736.1 hypothetical protein [Candidatus Cloacimonadota bacterium]